MTAKRKSPNPSVNIYFSDDGLETYKLIQAKAKKDKRSISQTILLMLQSQLEQEDNQ